MSPSAPVPAEPTAKERFSWIAKNSRILIIALIVLIVAIVVSIFSFGLFTTSSANPGNTATSGIMDQVNDQEGEAVLTAAALLPGESADGTVSITNVGDADGEFTLTSSPLTAESDVELAAVLQLTVTAAPALSTAGGAEVFNGALADFANVEYNLGEWPAGEDYTFTFTVAFPPGDTSGDDNDYQDMAVEFDLTWDAIQSTDEG